MRRSHSANHKLVGEVCVESKRPIFNLNHGLVGDDIPLIIPADKFRAAIVPVESRMCWLIGEPRFCWFWVMSHLYLLGRMKSANSLACVHHEYLLLRRPNNRPCWNLRRSMSCSVTYSE